MHLENVLQLFQQWLDEFAFGLLFVEAIRIRRDSVKEALDCGVIRFNVGCI